MTDTKTSIVDALRARARAAVSHEATDALNAAADALEAAEQRAAALAAVVEKARWWIEENRPIKCTFAGAEEDDAGIVLSLLNTDPSDALREHDAQVRAEERERIVTALRGQFGVTNRAASWIERGTGA